MKKLFLLLTIAIWGISCSKTQSPENTLTGKASDANQASITKKSGTVLGLRLLENDLLVGYYTPANGTVTITNLSGFSGSTFDDINMPANTYNALDISISHTNFNCFYLEFTGTNAAEQNIRVGLPLYVGDKNVPNPNFINCPKETHSCNGGTTCSCCSFSRNASGCVIGCSNCGPSCKKNADAFCSHTVTTSQLYADYVRQIADNPAM